MATGFASGHQDTGAASGDGPNLPGLAESARMVATGAVSSRELVEDCLERIAVSQADLNAFRLVRAEAALAEADAADAAVASGSLPPLLGVPIAIKDDTDLAGETTPFGCGGELEPALNDAELVRRLRAAGAVIVGKTQAPEVGQWHFTESDAFGATRNPWSLGHTPGGSSGGAAAAVAAGLVPAAIGSDGAGSVRIPAAWNGLVGLKPQRGRISTWPEPEAFNGLTCFGPLTRSAADAALLLDALRGNVPADLHQPAPPAEPYAITAATAPRRLRIALSFSIPPGVADHLDDEVRERVEGFAAMLTGLGHEVVRADPPYGPVGAALIPRGMAGVEAWIEERGIDRAALEARTKVHARVGRALSGLPLRLARAAEAPLRAWIGRVFDDHDLVLTPATANPPPAIGALAGRGYWASSSIAAGTCPYAFPWNVTGWPALSLPAGLTAAGLPVGAQLAAPEGEEGLLLALAGEVEAAVGGWPASPYARAL